MLAEDAEDWYLVPTWKFKKKRENSNSGSKGEEVGDWMGQGWEGMRES